MIVDQFWKLMVVLELEILRVKKVLQNQDILDYGKRVLVLQAFVNSSIRYGNNNNTAHINNVARIDYESWNTANRTNY